MRSDLTDIEVVIYRQTDEAMLVSVCGDAGRIAWVPKGQVEIFPSRTGTATITLPAQLARDKRLT